jgi:hypothetical protein
VKSRKAPRLLRSPIPMIEMRMLRRIHLEAFVVIHLQRHAAIADLIARALSLRITAAICFLRITGRCVRLAMSSWGVPRSDVCRLRELRQDRITLELT